MNDQWFHADSKRRSAALISEVRAHLSEVGETGSRDVLLSMYASSERVVSRGGLEALRTDDTLARGAATLIFAGLDTRVGNLNNCLWLLASHPTHQSALRDALASTPLPMYEPRACAYLDAVCKESQRLQPTPSHIKRTVAAGGIELGAHFLEPGTILMIDIYAAHRDERWWGERANEYDPTRFLAADEGRPRGAYIPFGMGSSQCPGSVLGQTEQRTAVAAVIASRRLALTDTPTTIVQHRPVAGSLETLTLRCDKA